MARIQLQLDAALRRAGLSGRELARRAGCNKDTVTRYRRNPRVVDLDVLERLCTALHCALRDVLTDQPPSPTTRTGTPPPTFPDGAPTAPLSTWSYSALRAFREAWSDAWWAYHHGRGPDCAPVGPATRRWPPGGAVSLRGRFFIRC